MNIKCLFGHKLVTQSFANVYGYFVECERCHKIIAEHIEMVNGEQVDRPGFSHGPINLTASVTGYSVTGSTAVGYINENRIR